MTFLEELMETINYDLLAEGRIILPTACKSKSWLEKQLITNFGGYTNYSGTGAYYSEKGRQTIHEAVEIWDVAVSLNPKLHLQKRFTDLLLELLAQTSEECIYARLPGGPLALWTRESIRAYMVIR